MRGLTITALALVLGATGAFAQAQDRAMTHEPPRSFAEAQTPLSRAAATIYDAKALYSSSGMSAERTAIAGYQTKTGDAPTDLRDALAMLALNEQKRGARDVAKSAFAEAFAISDAAAATADTVYVLSDWHWSCAQLGPVI